MANKTKISFKNLFNNKKFSIVFSIVAAVVIWFSVTVTESPDSENTIGGLPVSVPIENTVVSQMGMDIVSNTSEYNVSVTVKGPAYVVSSLRAEDILVTASTVNVTTAGTYTLDLKATKQATAEGEFEIISISPKTINVAFDYIDTKQFDVLAQATGYKAVDGLTAELPFVSDSNNASLIFKGARTDIEKIDKVVATAKVDKTLSASETFKGELKILDKDGKEISAEKFTITTADGLSAPDIQITVPIYKEKMVPIRAQFINAPDHFAAKIISHKLEYNTVLISGPPEAIEKITEIKLSEIDFNKIGADNQVFKTTLILPEGIINKDNIETVKVTITGLDDYISRTFTVSKLVVTGGSGKATFTRNIKNVKVFGPKSVLKSLSASDLYAQIDITGLEPGEHTVSATIKCRKSGKVWQNGNYTASVNVK